jgi:hypothetical protein
VLTVRETGGARIFISYSRKDGAEFAASNGGVGAGCSSKPSRYVGCAFDAA